jgi:hypothetical protein
MPQPLADLPDLMPPVTALKGALLATPPSRPLLALFVAGFPSGWAADALTR